MDRPKSFICGLIERVKAKRDEPKHGSEAKLMEERERTQQFTLKINGKRKKCYVC